MNTLLKSQENLLAWLLHGDEQIKAQIVETTKVNANTRLGIYAEAYRLRLLEALQDSFPALHTLLGDQRFQDLGLAYIEAYPSQHFSIRYFGNHLSDFLATTPIYQKTPILHEMAVFEWTLRDVFDAADSTTISLETLHQISPEQWENLHFQFHPSVRRIDFNWNVPQLWKAIEQDEAPIEPQKNEYPIGWLFWRKDLKTFFRSLTVDEAWALDAIFENHNFAEICAGLCEWIDEMNAAQRAADLVLTWINEALITAIET